MTIFTVKHILKVKEFGLRGNLRCPALFFTLEGTIDLGSGGGRAVPAGRMFLLPANERLEGKALSRACLVGCQLDRSSLDILRQSHLPLFATADDGLPLMHVHPRILGELTLLVMTLADKRLNTTLYRAVKRLQLCRLVERYQGN